MILPLKQNALKRLFISFNVVVYFAILILSTLVFVAPKAQAASIYDEAYQTTGALYAKHPTCFARSIDAGTLGWMSYNDMMTNSQKDVYEQASRDYRVMSQGYGTNGTSTSDDTAFARIITAYDASSAYFDWSYNTLQQKGSVLVRPIDGEHIITEIRQRSNTHDDSCELYISTFTRSVGGYVISQEPPDDYEYFIRNYVTVGDVDFNYPDGYMGREVVDNFSEVVSTTYPYVLYEVVDKQITLTYQNNIAPLLPSACQGVSYRFYNDVGTEVKYESVGYDNLHTDPVIYEFSDYGTKSVRVEWSQSNLPACAAFNEDDNIETVISDIKINLDGSTFASHNMPSNENCDMVGDCRPPTEIIDCSVYHPITDMGEFMICWIHNINEGFRSWFISLFIPSDFRTKLNNLMDNFTGQLGFIAFPFTYLTDFYKKIAEDNVYTCTTSGCVRNFGGFFGKNVTIDFATLYQISPTAWNTLTGIARGMIVFFLVLGLVNKYKEVTHR